MAGLVDLVQALLARIGEGLGYEPSETLELQLPHATVAACVGFDPGA